MNFRLAQITLVKMEEPALFKIAKQCANFLVAAPMSLLDNAVRAQFGLSVIVIFSILLESRKIVVCGQIVQLFKKYFFHFLRRFLGVILELQFQ